MFRIGIGMSERDRRGFPNSVHYFDSTVGYFLFIPFFCAPIRLCTLYGCVGYPS
jgi:hypothetical protein